MSPVSLAKALDREDFRGAESWWTAQLAFPASEAPYWYCLYADWNPIGAWYKACLNLLVGTCGRFHATPALSVWAPDGTQARCLIAVAVSVLAQFQFRQNLMAIGTVTCSPCLLRRFPVDFEVSSVNPEPYPRDYRLQKSGGSLASDRPLQSCLRGMARRGDALNGRELHALVLVGMRVGSLFKHPEFDT